MRRKVRIALFCTVILVAGVVLATTFDTVQVIARRMTSDGHSISCVSAGCGFTVAESTPPIRNRPEVGEGGGGGLRMELTKSQFCQILQSQRPSNCNAHSPPRSPGIIVINQGTWQPNGCGPQSWGGRGLANVILTLMSSQSYSGDIDAPYPGVSFKAACDTHDRCWATQANSRAECDIAFRDTMFAACAHLTLAENNTCTGFAGNYHGAVSTSNKSHQVHAAAVADRACALWARDMRVNGCGN